jgi:16S rRNA (cytosine967-C5)-methyltransferase
VASARKDIDMRRLVREQRALLHAAAALVRPGGVVVYSTCSLLPVESEEQTAAFLLELAATEGGPTLERLALRADELPAELVCAINGAGELRILPSMCADVGGVDGFFVSRFRRTS